jgi:hypothetical protein
MTVMATVLTIAALGFLGYVLYLERRSVALERRSYRDIAALSRQLGSRLDGLREQVWARVLQPDFAERGCGAFKDVPQLQCHGSVTGLPPPDGLDQRTRTNGGDGVIDLYFRVGQPDPRVYLCAHPSGGGPAAEWSAFCASTSLWSRLNELPASRFGFDAVAVGTEDGTILTSAGQIEIPIAHLGEGLETAALATGGAQHSPKPGEEPDGSGQPPHGPLQTAKSSRGKLSLGGEGYRVFGTPLVVGAPPGVAVNAWDIPGESVRPKRKVLWLFGLIEEGRLRAEQRRLPYWGTVSVLLILLVASLSWWLLKIWLLAPKERLRAVDVRLLAVSLLVLVAALTVMAQAVRTHGSR